MKNLVIFRHFKTLTQKMALFHICHHVLFSTFTPSIPMAIKIIMTYPITYPQ